MLMGGRCGERQVIPTRSSTISPIMATGAWKKAEFAAGFGGRDMGYRSGWYVINDEPKTLFALGIHAQNLFVDRTTAW
jgi:hypothetical protein